MSDQGTGCFFLFACIVCATSSHLAFHVVEHYAEISPRKIFPVRMDNRIKQPAVMPCDMPNTTSSQHPNTSFYVIAVGITYANSGWTVSACVNFPEIYLDVCPYPTTLVCWPTFVLNGGLPESSGSGSADYMAVEPGNAVSRNMSGKTIPAATKFLRLLWRI